MPTPDLRAPYNNNKENHKPPSGGQPPTLGGAGVPPAAPIGMKKGMTKFYLNDEDKRKYLDYDPIRPSIINWEELKNSDNFAIKSYKDSVYRGELKESKRDGKGIITYNSSRVYEGEWQGDKRHGIGYERFSNENVYEGEYY
jgi:hypothetical protein|tara:strand:+ start:427 stop:852 length:426 start_codon:yes stop_codon:yes gene_type:complete